MREEIIKRADEILNEGDLEFLMTDEHWGKLGEAMVEFTDDEPMRDWMERFATKLFDSYPGSKSKIMSYDYDEEKFINEVLPYIDEADLDPDMGNQLYFVDSVLNYVGFLLEKHEEWERTYK